jgi:hypothetical protein
LEVIRDKLERGDEKSVTIALSVVDRLLAGIDDEPEEHLRKIRKELADLDGALAVCDHKAEKQGDEWIKFYLLPCGPWHRVLALRSNVVALSGALAAGHPTVPCSTCHRWIPVVMEDVEDGYVTMRCPDGHEHRARVVTLPADMRGENALRFLPRPSE